MPEAYEYLLPVFVGHPFEAEYTSDLRSVIASICQEINADQRSAGSRFLWQPQFLNTLDSSRPETILDAVRQAIRQAAFCIFEITDKSKANVFFELGVAMGMGRALVLIARAPYEAPSDVQNIRRIEYASMVHLKGQLEALMRVRLQELRLPPHHDQEIIHQKMQIDANWRYRLKTAGKSMYFIAGDLSWADDYADDIAEACRRGVNVQICCRRPKETEDRKWQNIMTLKRQHAEIRMFAPALDPRIRGFIVDPEEMDENTEIMLVEKQTRSGGSQDYERMGITVGESRYLYKAQVYRGHTHLRHVIALVRLFETLWENPQVENYALP